MKKELESEPKQKQKHIPNQVHDRLRSYSRTARQNLEEFSGSESDRKYLTDKQTVSGHPSESLSLQIAKVTSSIEDITAKMTKNIASKKQIQRRIQDKKQIRQKEILQNLTNIPQLKEKIELKGRLIELMENQSKRIKDDQPMSIQQKLKIYTNIRESKSQIEKNAKKTFDKQKQQNSLKYKMYTKDIDNKIKQKIKNLQNNLLHSKIYDEKISLLEIFQKGLMQFKQQNENQLEQLRDRELQQIRQSLDPESDLFALNFKYQQKFKQCEQQKKGSTMQIKQQYYKLIKNIEKDYNKEMEELNKRRQNIQKNLNKQQEMVKQSLDNKEEKDKRNITDGLKQQYQKMILQFEELQMSQLLFNKQKRPQMDELNLKIVQISNNIKQLNTRLMESENNNTRRQYEEQMQKMKILKNDLDQRLKGLKQQQQYIQSRKNNYKDYQYGREKITQQLQKRKKEAYEEAEKRYQQKYQEQKTKFEDKKKRGYKKCLKLQQQYKTKYYNGKQICSNNFQRQQSLCQSKYQQKKNRLLQKLVKDLQPRLKSYPSAKNIYLNKLKKYQQQLKQYIHQKEQLKKKYEKEQDDIVKMEIQTNQQIQEVYKRDQNRLSQCFKSKQPQQSRFFIQKNLEKHKKQYQNLTMLFKKQLQKQQKFKIPIIWEEQQQFKYLKQLQQQYGELQFKKTNLLKNSNQLLKRQQNKYNFGKIQSNLNQNIVFKRRSLVYIKKK